MMSLAFLEQLTHLSDDELDIVDRDSLVVGSNDQLQQVVSQHLKHHADI